MKYVEWISTFTNWKPIFDYWEHFSFVESGGPERIQGLYDAFFEDSKTDHRKLTELSITMNHKVWQKSQNPLDKKVCDLYSKLAYYTNEYAIHHLCGDELSYYLETKY